MIESGVIEVNDPRYPKALKEALANLIPSLGPKRLYYKGNWDAISRPCLAVVGSRRLTQYGSAATAKLVSEIAGSGIVIVSGFMYGGDKAAHQAAVSVGGKTIAVMPCGINLVHPAEQEGLYQEILDKGGLILSEYEDKTQPQLFTYVQRDRIVAGLSKAIFVTEASLNSGSLITAGYAKKFGRKLFALPGQITSEVAQGTVTLIRQGAEAVLEAKDIITFFHGEQITIGAELAKKQLTTGENELENKILDQLAHEPMKTDDLARLFVMPVAQIGTALSMMEMKGIIKQTSGTYHLA